MNLLVCALYLNVFCQSSPFGPQTGGASAGRSISGSVRQTPPQTLALTDEKYNQLLKSLLQAAARYDAKEEYKDYESCDNLGRNIVLAATKARTTLLISTLSRLGKTSSAEVYILEALSKVGDPAEVTPYFLKALEGTKTPGYEMYASTTYVARSYIMHDSDPRAVAFLLSALADPKADHVIREEAYSHVAGTGGLRGARAVLPLQNPRRLLAPLSKRVLLGFVNAGEFGVKTNVVSQKTDRSGNQWALVENGALGDVGDLWLVEKVNGKWADPIFTGVSDEKRFQRWDKNAVTPRIHGLTGDRLIGADWLTIIRADASLTRRTAKSNLTDLERHRFGLAARNGDSCAFRLNPNTYSERKRTVIPTQSEQSFRAKANTDSERIRTGVPTQIERGRLGDFSF